MPDSIYVPISHRRCCIACQFMQDRKIEMYAWLPAMENANGRLLLQAIDEMVEYYQGNEAKFGEHLLWFGLFFRRADLLPLQEKLLVEERLNTFQQLIEEDELVRKQREMGEQIGFAKGKQEGLAEGKQEGLAEGETKALQDTLLMIIEMRFPSLLAWAQQQVVSIQELDALRFASRQMLVAPDEATARFILRTMQK